MRSTDLAHYLWLSTTRNCSGFLSFKMYFSGYNMPIPSLSQTFKTTNSCNYCGSYQATEHFPNRSKYVFPPQTQSRPCSVLLFLFFFFNTKTCQSDFIIFTKYKKKSWGFINLTRLIALALHVFAEDWCWYL